MTKDRFSFEDLEVYQKALDFAVAVIDVIDQLDTPRKHYRLIEQLEGSCTSVASNIAEGSSRQSDKDFGRFLQIALGSSFELDTQCEVVKELYVGFDKELTELQDGDVWDLPRV